ncbi:TPA: PrgH/EprH family type III secretion apparatus protein [Citrobacter pasteurii]
MEDSSQNAGMDSPPHYVMKVLSGPMYGVDIPLPYSETVYVSFISQEQLLTVEQGEMQSLFNSTNSIVVPSTGEQSTSFLLSFTLSPNESGIAVFSQLLSTAGNPVYQAESEAPEKNALLLNTPVEIGFVTVALKAEEDVWHPDVSNSHKGTVSSTADPDVNSALIADNKSPTYSRCLQNRFYRLTLLCTVLFIFFTAISVGYFFVADNSRSVRNVLLPIAPDVIKLKNGNVYIITKTDANAEWGWQALIKDKINTSNIHMISLESARLELPAMLHEMKMPFHRLELTGSRDITIAFSKERCTESICNAAFRTFIARNYPWINNISVDWFSDRDIVALANRKLNDLQLQFTTSIMPSHARFIVHGVLEGEQYSALENTMTTFMQEYGSEYVQFVFDLEEPGLRPLTYRSGDDSYAITSDYHWLYPY